MKHRIYKIVICVVAASLVICIIPIANAHNAQASETGETTTIILEETSETEDTSEADSSISETSSEETSEAKSAETQESSSEDTTSATEETTVAQTETEETTVAATETSADTIYDQEYIENNLLDDESIDEGTESSNASLVKIAKTSKDFRFVKIKKNTAVFTKNSDIYESADKKAKTVGTISKYGTCSILLKVSDDWYYVESGLVRGFVPSKVLSQTKKALKKASSLTVAIPTVPVTENSALSYTQTTTRDIIAKKVYIVAYRDIFVLNEKTDKMTKSNVVGTLNETNLAYLLSDEQDGWYYIESGDVRGFAKADDFYTIEESTDAVKEYGESAFVQAKTTVDPSENSCLYYTLKSVKKSTYTSSTGSMIWPLDSEYNYISSWFGARDVISGSNFTTSSNHNGIDIPADEKSPIYAVLPGKVVINVTSDSAGNYLVIDHGNGLYTEYMHMYSQSPIAVGETVTQGQIIGFVGSTGWSTGNHLHFGVMVGGVGSDYRVDPAPYLGLSTDSDSDK